MPDVQVSVAAVRQAVAGDCRQGDASCAADHRVRQNGARLHELIARRSDYAAQRRWVRLKCTVCVRYSRRRVASRLATGCEIMSGTVLL